MGMLNNYGQGANLFAQNFMEQINQGRKFQFQAQEMEMMNKLRQAQLDELVRKKALGEEISQMTQPQYQSYMANDPEAPPDTLSPFGQQKLAGMMGSVPKNLTAPPDPLGLANKDFLSQQVGNPNYAPAQQAALAQLKQQRGETVTPEFDISKSYTLLAKADPTAALELGAKLKAAKDTTELKQAMLDVKEGLAKVGFSYKEKEHELKEKYLEWKEKNADKQMDFDKWKALLTAAKGDKPPEAQRAYDLWSAAKVKRGEKAPDFDFFYEKVYKTPNAASFIFGGLTPPGASGPQKLDYNPKTGKFE
jgi:hypothetical protein